MLCSLIPHIPWSLVLLLHIWRSNIFHWSADWLEERRNFSSQLNWRFSALSYGYSHPTFPFFYQVRSPRIANHLLIPQNQAYTQSLSFIFPMALFKVPSLPFFRVKPATDVHVIALQALMCLFWRFMLTICWWNFYKKTGRLSVEIHMYDPGVHSESYRYVSASCGWGATSEVSHGLMGGPLDEVCKLSGGSVASFLYMYMIGLSSCYFYCT